MMADDTSGIRSKKKILIADDDAGILDATKLLLEAFDYDVIVDPNGKLLQSNIKELPDLILLDIWMSGINGKDICLKLKKQRKTTSIPVIMVSANKDTSDIAKQAGADDYIAKPFDSSTLITKIEKYTSGKI